MPTNKMIQRSGTTSDQDGNIIIMLPPPFQGPNKYIANNFKDVMAICQPEEQLKYVDDGH
jgi:hypothetical protein